ncbi:prepilin peptidase [Alteribacillus sp. HJP-4]|uniref:prepilin peptidase n=1 Tax=Alteribacillus sp. HJP-4 TaxID=2775394 RepID=UPI0035CCFBEE
MEAVYILYITTAGLILGSFYNVVGMRLPAGESFIYPRSNCPKCGTALVAMELIPLFSYVLLKGKGKCCGTKLSPLYPLIEAATAGLFVGAWLLYGFSWEFLSAVLFLSLLVIITVTDIRYMRIPDKILLFFGVMLVLLRVSTDRLEPWWDMAAGTAAGFFLLLLIGVVSKGGMGGGDIKLFAIIGLFFGWELTLVAFFLSVLLGAAAGLPGLVAGKVKRGVPIPFGPFIAAGSILTLFWGRALLDWYLKGMF